MGSRSAFRRRKNTGYSNEKYSPCDFKNGTFFGTPEEAFEASALYLVD
jgi:hypothetical protein